MRGGRNSTAGDDSADSDSIETRRLVVGLALLTTLGLTHLCCAALYPFFAILIADLRYFSTHF